MTELNVKGYEPYAQRPNISCPPNRIVVSRPPLEDHDVGIIATTTGINRPDLGTVLAVGRRVPYRQLGTGNWVPADTGSEDYELPSVGDTVLLRYDQGIGIVNAELGEGCESPEVRAYGQGIPSGAVRHRDVQLVPLWRSVMAVMKNEQFIKMLGDNILVQGDPEKSAQGSILLPETLRRPSGMGYVLLSGPLAIKSGIRPGSRVCFDITASKVAKIAGDHRQYIMRPESILYVVTE